MMLFRDYPKTIIDAFSAPTHQLQLHGCVARNLELQRKVAEQVCTQVDGLRGAGKGRTWADGWRREWVGGSSRASSSGSGEDGPGAGVGVGAEVGRRQRRVGSPPASLSSPRA